MPLARAALEAILRTRQLDRTLTTSLPDWGTGLASRGTRPGSEPDRDLSPTNIAALDAQLGGGIPRGQISELVGPRSSGRTSLLLQLIAEATGRGELVGLVDALDMLDVESATAAGVDLSRLLWVRGHVGSNPGLCGDLNQRA